MKEICQNIILYLDGDLDEKERARFESHLTGCNECQEFLSTWGNFYSEGWISVEPLTEQEKQNIWKRLQNIPEMRRIETGLIAASVVFILLNVLYFYFIVRTQNSYDIDHYLQYSEQLVEKPYEDPMADFLFTYVIDGENHE